MAKGVIVPKPTGLPTVEELVERNKEYAAHKHQAWPTLAALTTEASPSVLVIACADPRCDPDQFLQGKPLEYLAVRVVGGRAETALPDVITLDSLFEFKTLIIVHHTDCGSTYMSPTGIRETLRQRAPGLSSAAIDAIPIRTFDDAGIAQSVADDLAFLRASPVVRKELREAVHGFVYDLTTGLLSPVA